VIKTVVRLLVLAGTAVLLAVSWPDIKRYAAIRRASAGIHPEMIPARGRTRYPRSHAAGAMDGTGDFDSAWRGGPTPQTLRNPARG